MGTPAITLQTSTTVLTADIRPAVLSYFPIPIRNGGYTIGRKWIYSNGYTGFSDIGGATPYFTAGAISGVNFPTQISYAI